MKIVDITEVIANQIEKKIFGEWKHDGYIDGFTSDQACAVIDGKIYRITVQEVAEDEQVFI